MSDKYDQSHSEELGRREHVDKNLGAKRVLLYGYDANADEILPLAAVESADTPGVYGLLVLNADGSAVSTGGGTTASVYGTAVYGTGTYS